MSKRAIKEEKQCLHYLYRLVYPKFLQDFNQYIERDVAWNISRDGFRVKEVVHDWDPSYDCSGKLVGTSQLINSQSSMYFQDFAELHTGNTIASYESGCGFYYPRFVDEWDEAFHYAWDDITLDFFKFCLENRLFTHFIFEQLGEDYENIGDFSYYGEDDIGDWSVHEVTELVVFGKNPVISELYQKYQIEIEFYYRRLAYYYDCCKRVEQQLMEEYKSIQPRIHLNKKITNNLEDKTILNKLQEQYSSLEIALLSKFGDISLSNKIRLPYEDVLQKYQREQLNMEYPSYNLLPRHSEEFYHKILI